MAPDGFRASLRSELTVFYWFFYRNLVQQFSFRSWFVMRILGLIISVTTFSIFAQVVPAASVQEAVLERYNIVEGRKLRLKRFQIQQKLRNSKGIKEKLN